MTKEKTPYNDLELWQSYRQRCAAEGLPKTSDDALRIAAPAVHASLYVTARQWGVSMPSTPYNGEAFAETRVPIARAATAIRKAEKSKGADTKRRHLETAMAWLAAPHPWQGKKTAAEIKAMLTHVDTAIAATHSGNVAARGS